MGRFQTYTVSMWPSKVNKLAPTQIYISYKSIIQHLRNLKLPQNTHLKHTSCWASGEIPEGHPLPVYYLKHKDLKLLFINKNQLLTIKNCQFNIVPSYVLRLGKQTRTVDRCLSTHTPRPQSHLYQLAPFSLIF